MKKFKIIIIILILFILLATMFFAIDYLRVQKQEKPIFCIQNRAGEINDGGTVEYFGLGYKVIDFNRLDGYNEIKIGLWTMDYYDFAEEFEKEQEIIQSDEKNNTDGACFYGKVVESSNTYIIVEPNKGEPERKSSDKISIGLGQNNDVIYEIGTNVKITYDGMIMESYPAKIKASKIEIKSVDKFNLVFYQKTMIRPKQIETIIKKGEIKNIDYNVYAFEGHVAINLNSDSPDFIEGSISLREALLQNKITMDEIIQKANKDFPNAISYDDGGSIEYHYDNYTIIKVHKLDGNRDVYIGESNMKLNDLILK